MSKDSSIYRADLFYGSYAKMDACIQLSTVTNNLFMKYICRNDNHILDKIMDYYKQLYEIDYLLVRELYDCLTACI